MQIKSMINKEQALKLFDDEAALFGCGMYNGSSDTGVPLYRIGELFGVSLLEVFERDRGQHRVFKPGRDFGLNCAAYERFSLEVIYLNGFLQMVMYHNRHIAHENHLASESGQYLEAMSNSQKARLDAEQEEELRKIEERRVKRAAARKAKQEAAEQAVSA